MSHLQSQIAGWMLTAALLASQASVAQRWALPEPREADTSTCSGCVPAPGAESLSGISYRGRLDGNAGSLAVLVRDGREQIVAVGDNPTGDWTVVAIDAQAVLLRDVVAGLEQYLWFGGGAGTVGLIGPPPRAPIPLLNWRFPSSVPLGGEFSVVLSLPGLDVKSGVITLEYDPDVLTVVDATGKWEGHRGQTRLLITDVSDGDDLAEIAIRVVAPRPTVTRLWADAIELIDAGGNPVTVTRGDHLRIEVATPPDPEPELK